MSDDSKESVPLEDLSTELQAAYHAVARFINHDEEASPQILCHYMEQQVTQHPILARVVVVVTQEDQGGSSSSLMTLLCQKLLQDDRWSLEAARPAIQCLINQCPECLTLDRWGVHDDEKNLHYLAAVHDYDIMPWIARHHASILDHPVCRVLRPHFVMMRRYQARLRRHHHDEDDDEDEYHSDERSIVHSLFEFFTHYPRALQQCDDNGLLPIHYGIQSLQLSSEHPHVVECNQTYWKDLIIFMARNYPEGLRWKDASGMTPLFHACSGKWRRDISHSMLLVCEFLMELCPNSVTIKANAPLNCPPLNHLLSSCHSKFPNCQKLILALLRSYPESIRNDDVTFTFLAAPGDYSRYFGHLGMFTEDFIAPRDLRWLITPARGVNFVRTVEPLLLMERQFQEALEQQTALANSLNCVLSFSSSCDEVQLEAGRVIKSWLDLKMQESRDKLENQLPSMIQTVCKSHMEEGRPQLSLYYFLAASLLFWTPNERVNRHAVFLASSEFLSSLPDECTRDDFVRVLSSTEFLTILSDDAYQQVLLSLRDLQTKAN